MAQKVYIKLLRKALERWIQIFIQSLFHHCNWLPWLFNMHQCEYFIWPKKSVSRYLGGGGELFETHFSTIIIYNVRLNSKILNTILNTVFFIDYLIWKICMVIQSIESWHIVKEWTLLIFMGVHALIFKKLKRCIQLSIVKNPTVSGIYHKNMK